MQQAIRLHRFHLFGRSHRVELLLSLHGLPFEKIAGGPAKTKQERPAAFALECLELEQYYGRFLSCDHRSDRLDSDKGRGPARPAGPAARIVAALSESVRGLRDAIALPGRASR